MASKYGNNRGLGYGYDEVDRDRPSAYQRNCAAAEKRDLSQITAWREERPEIGRSFRRWINQQNRECYVVAHGPGGRYAYIWNYGEDSQGAREREKYGQVDDFVRIGGGKIPKIGGISSSELTCSRKRLPKWARDIEFEVED